MTDYVKAVNFATKDALVTGDPLKVVKGAEINTELDNLATSIATKFDKSGGTITGATSITSAVTLTSSLNLARGSIVQHATTMDLWALPNILDGTGSAVTITAIANAPQAGASRTVYFLVGTVITDGATFNVQGNASYTTKAGDALVFTAITTNTYYVDIVTADGTAIGTKQIQSITATAASGALTITLLPTSLSYRSATLTSGTITTVVNAANLSTVISSGSTAGGTSAVALRLVILAINNAGVSELAWTNLAGGVGLDETGVITTVAEGGAGAADSASVIYSTTARTNVAYRVVGFLDITNTTAGTWLDPTTIQGIGGQALAALSSLGYGQTWQTVTRAASTTYYNITGKPIQLNYSVTGGASAVFTLTINGVAQGAVTQGLNSAPLFAANILTPGTSYSYTLTANTLVAQELR